uniref:ATP synthase subunit a n=1 Tax=Ochromonas danica TaxID=2986 RepID=Q9G8Z2_OCHDN|nr:ATP synthase F0 subunit 6 [Ochromonas danica]AAG18413.1 ATP synthase F0 subunit 6 [Ochromonas danica]
MLFNCMNILYTSPLEQFRLFPFFDLRVGAFDISFTNISYTLLLIFVASVVFFFSLVNKYTEAHYNKTFFIVPSFWQGFVEFLYKAIVSTVSDNISIKNTSNDSKNERAQFFVPLIFCVFTFICSINLFGLIPYNPTLTSHLIATLTIGTSVFFMTVWLGVAKHGIQYFKTFLPTGTRLGLAFLLVPIEFISFIFKPVSLSLRLFVNIVAGHTLLHTIAAFVFIEFFFVLGKPFFLYLVFYIPVFAFLCLFILETAVCLIQAFVFSILICIYIDSAFNLH